MLSETMGLRHDANETEFSVSVSTDILIQATLGLQQILDNQLALTVIDRQIQPGSLTIMQGSLSEILANKDELARRFEASDVLDYFNQLVNTDLFIFTAKRLMHVLSLADTPHIFDTYSLKHSEKSSLFFLPPIAQGIIEEAVCCLPIREKLAGFRINQKDHSQIIDYFFLEDDGNLSKLSVEIGQEEETKIANMRQSKRILIAVEGDMSGHAIRALETARGLRRLGYEPAIVGNGDYMCFFENEGFMRLLPFSSKPSGEREKIITHLRGEGKSIFPWSYRTIKDRGIKTESELAEYVKAGLDLFLYDTNFITAIAVKHLEQKYGKQFPSLTQVHDINFSPSRPLRAFKISNLPIGEILYTVKHSTILQSLDPNEYLYAKVYSFFNKIGNTIIGLPLLAYDYFYREKPVHLRNLRLKFTDYAYGRDGTLLFSLISKSKKTDCYPVGIQAERGQGAGLEQDQWELDIAREKLFILNAQGSTYHKEAWNNIVRALSETPDCFSVHATGKKEDIPTPIYKMDTEKGVVELAGYKVGYVAGYRLAGIADIVINHGGFGTISQWLLATADGVQERSRTLCNMVLHSDVLEIMEFLKSCRKISRSISVCNTFEQENNALIINELGGNNVCTVITADNLMKKNPKEKIKELISRALSTPVNNKERSFWLNTVKNISTMNSPAHIALILERIMTTNTKYH